MEFSSWLGWCQAFWSNRAFDPNCDSRAAGVDDVTIWLAASELNSCQLPPTFTSISLLQFVNVTESQRLCVCCLQVNGVYFNLAANKLPTIKRRKMCNLFGSFVPSVISPGMYLYLYLRLSDEILILILIMFALLFRPRIPSRFVSVSYIYKLPNAFAVIHPPPVVSYSQIELYVLISL